RSSGASNCVEVAHVDEWTAVRDSKNKTGPVLLLAHDEWNAFVRNVGEARWTRTATTSPV
ncbi:MAG: DUF397 domain-containing protein, partial [Pseudonocardiaceae bacterium]